MVRQIPNGTSTDPEKCPWPSDPWIKPVAPFNSWDERSATQTLPWYDAYNAAKRDRESELKRASLRLAFDAVVACAIMIVAQFGEVFGFDLIRSKRTFPIAAGRRGVGGKLLFVVADPRG